MDCVNIAFEKAKEKVIGVDRERPGIGTLGEKTVHAILKHYYEPDEAFQEIKVAGYVADICKNGEIIEIQTGNFDKLRKKLTAYLPEHEVTIVYPIPREKYLIWIDEESGELTDKRKSPKKGTGYLAFSELYKIKNFLMHPHLHFKFVLLDMEEYRLLNGWSKDKKKGSTRFDRIPYRLVEEITVFSIKDYRELIPYEKGEQFTVKDFAKAVHITSKVSGKVLHILAYLGVIEKVGTQKRAYLYEIKE